MFIIKHDDLYVRPLACESLHHGRIDNDILTPLEDERRNRVARGERVVLASIGEKLVVEASDVTVAMVRGFKPTGLVPPGQAFAAKVSPSTLGEVQRRRKPHHAVDGRPCRTESLGKV